MTVTAKVTFPDGREAVVSGPDKESVRARIATLKGSTTEPSNELDDRSAQLDPVEIGADIPELGDPEKGADEKALREISSLLGGRDIRGKARLAPDVGRDVVGLAETGGTVVTGGALGIIGGFAGALNLLLGANVDDTVANMKRVMGWTYSPKTESGKMALEAISVPLVALEDGADRISEYLSMGNPAAATIIKTTLLGATSLATPAKGTAALTAAKLTLRRQAKQVRGIANELGITPRLRRSTDEQGTVMGDSIIEAARRMTPDERAQNAPALKAAIQEAENAARTEKKSLYDVANRSRAWVETGAVRDLAVDAESALRQLGYDVPDMPILNKRLADLSVDTPMTRARLSELEIVRKRINRNRSANPAENSALDFLKRQIDEFLDNEFNNVALGNGGAVSGDPAALQAWKSAREANSIWRDNFYKDKVIAQLIQKDATPEAYRQWLVGATAMGARREAATTIARLKQVLGDDHPVIEGIRQDFLFEVAEPLLQIDPNFSQFVRNYDRMIRRNPSIVKELGLDTGNFRELVNFAEVQRRLPTPDKSLELTDVTKGVAQFFIGHKIAKAALRVNLFRGILNQVIGIDRVSQKSILYEIAGTKYGEVAIPKASPLAAEFIAGSAIAEISQK